VTPPAPDPGNPPPPADAVTFTADIRPILVANCGRCHASGGLPQFASANAATGFDVAFRERNSIVSEIRNGNMPADTCNGDPGSAGCVSVADFNLIQQWVAAGAPE
jgi:mono/diheme cytochrome c family protein